MIDMIHDVNLNDLSCDDLYDLAEETEVAIRDTEELQRHLLEFHENLCKAIIKKQREELNARS